LYNKDTSICTFIFTKRSVSYEKKINWTQ